MRRWWPFVLCCLPGPMVALFLLASSLLFGVGADSPLFLGLAGLAGLACPLSMVIMMRMHRVSSGVNTSRSQPMICCEPDETHPQTTPKDDTARLSERLKTY